MAQLISFKAIIIGESHDTYVMTPEKTSSLSTLYVPKSSLALPPTGSKKVQSLYGKPNEKFTVVTSATADRTHENVAGTFHTEGNIQFKNLTFQQFFENGAKDITGHTPQRTEIGLGNIHVA